MKKNLFISLLVIFMTSLTQLQATPVFAQQYHAKCSTCHSMMPTLNKTGLMFLRNGFRFGEGDPTVLSNFLDAKDNASRILPVHALVGVNTDTKTRSDVEKVNIYFGGRMTDTLSLYGVTRSTFNKKRNHELFGRTNSRGFIQWNPSGSKHVVKLGYMDPLTMFSNADRVLMDNGLMGSGLIKKAPKSKKQPTWSKQSSMMKKEQIEAMKKKFGSNPTLKQKKQLRMASMPKEPYKMAVPKAGVGLVKGIEYSYLYDEKALFLVNVGIPTSPFFATDDDFETTAGVQLRDVGGYDFGFIYSHQELANITSDSYIIPVEKDFFNGQLTYIGNLVYRDSDQYFNPYYGMDNSFVYQVNDDTQVRFIASFDRDEDETSNSGYTITYSKSWKDKYLMHLSGGTIRTSEFDESIAKISIYMFL